jgi:3'(2'), 5'-bisphosphate nucleotidase
MLVVKHEVELALYAHSQTYKWDSCAPEAIVHALGGIFTSQYGEPILYNSEIKNEPNSEGLICSFDEEIHRKVIEMCLEDRKNRQ